jgi:flagellar hook-associated protein 2
MTTTSATSALYLPSMYEAGLVTGLDSSSIISKLMSLARLPEAALQNKSDDDTAKSTVISNLLSKLSTLSTVVKKFGDASLPFFSQSASTSTNHSVVQGVVTGSQPTQGTYSLNITQIATAAIANSGKLYTGSDLTAQAAKIVSTAGVNASGQTMDAAQSLASQAAALGTAADASGTITVNGTVIAWDSSQSINTILGNINNANTGVTASWDGGLQTIALTSDAQGSASQVTLAQTAGNLLSVFNLTAGTAAGSDAAPTNAGVPLNSASVHLDRAVTSGTFTLNGVVFSVNAATDTLNNVLARINNSSAGVTATFNASTESITLIQKNTGSGNRIVLGAAGDTSNLLYALQLSNTNPPTGGAPDTVSGTDTLLSLNGGVVQAFSGTQITSLIPGVTVNAEGLGSAQLTVGADVETMVSTIQSFVSDYNDVMEFINTKISEDAFDSPTTADERIQGTFRSNANFLETKDRLTALVSSVVGSLPSSLNQLAQVGITTSAEENGTTGKLVLSESKLRSALASNPGGVDAMFNTSGTGIMSQIKTAITSLTDSSTGAFTVEKNMYAAETKNYAQQIADIEEGMVQKEAALRRQYAALETMVSQFNAIGKQLTALSSTSSTA